MSLVNQMLRDLEKRRAEERHGSGTLFEGLVTTAEPRGGRPVLLIALGVVTVALMAVTGYLLWERRAPASASPELIQNVSALHAAVVAPPVPESVNPSGAVPVTPGFVALEPAPERKIQTVVVGAEQATPVAPAASPAPAPRRHEAVPAVVAPVPSRAPVPAVAPVPARAPVAEAPAMIEKKPLPPTPEQLAAAAWQKGYEAMAAGQQEEAERQLREALRNEPGHVPARESLAGLLLTAGRRVEAAEVLETGLKLKPEAPGLRKLGARLRVEQGDLAGAVATLEGGAQFANRDGEYQALLGALYQRQGAYARSMQRYEQALLINQNQGVWWLGFAISAEGAGQKSDAVTAYQRALATGIGDKLAAYATGRLKVLEAELKKK